MSSPTRYLFGFSDERVFDGLLGTNRDKTPEDLPIRTFDVEFPFPPKTPFVDKILADQGITQDAFFALMGRWFFDMGDLDDWGVTPALIGLAGTGKSTILNALTKAYPRDKIGILSDVYSKFAVSGMVDCFSWVALEVKGDEGLRVRLQTPGKMTVFMKRAVPIVVDWRAPGIIAANEMPLDSRGLVVFEFGDPVMVPDCTLDEKLEAELPHIVVRAILTYRDFLTKYGRRGPVWP